MGETGRIGSRDRWRGFGMLAIGARGATQVRGKDGVHPEIVGQSSS